MPSQHHPVHLSLTFSNLQAKLLPTLKSIRTFSKIVERIKLWSGPIAELTEIICQEVIENATSIDETQPEKSVDRIVKASILNYWEGSPAAKHLNEVASSLLQRENKDLRLLSYLKILQRGNVPVAHTPEYQQTHRALLKSGLIYSDGATLKVSNALYANVFNTDWIEQQLPGITRPVSITKPSTDSQQPSKASGFYSKLAVFACCIAVLGAVVSAYRYESINKASATPSGSPTGSSTESLQAETQAQSLTDADQPENFRGLATVSPDSNNSQPIAEESTVSVVTTDRELFDQGVDHATNSRWLPMVREFCQLSPNSTYTTLAQRQLESWVKLYKEDIEIAQTTFTQEEGGECGIVSRALANNN